ncbi:5-(carboxyamino)imidazole ribonucleotide synthase [Evansella caseinilytica]|uniref:N5-carboxyaminoimidazole ribonucleotide synthase n=1 Tax=Evansella caseinilytica TaxID=1503961 RepID=A0A1H3FZP2_9BACI|nr:5-(carboxyamino)imidazole ribonucleotide synthase [Evansella caseinilytica]SDX96380.1 5-(carboxyamino)imidazole ribonucleotide synthase [Evansella caseinilytica]
MTKKWIQPGQTIGILGGGQLGRMMALSAREMGYGVAVLEPAPNSPCGQVADVQVEAGYNDLEGAARLAELCDVLTYEFENIHADTAAFLEKEMYLPQGSRLLTITQDRMLEKKTIASFNIPVVPYAEVSSRDDLTAAVHKLGLPAVLKTTRGGYDGKGQRVIRHQRELDVAWREMQGYGPFVLEAWLAFDKEISVIVARSVHGETAVFPVAENIHCNNILHQTIVPARIDQQTEAEAIRLAVRLAESLQLVGTLAVEMFVASDRIYVNELAPRPHNSGHYTINACETSQFEQHLRAICGWPLGGTALLTPAVMVNILGEHLPKVLTHIRELKGAHLHLYGKAEAKAGRKMGHVTVIAGSAAEALEEIAASPIWNESERNRRKQG